MLLSFWITVQAQLPTPAASQSLPTSAVPWRSGTELWETENVPNLIAAYGNGEIAIPDKLGPTYYLELPVCAPLETARPLSQTEWADAVVNQAEVYRSARTGRPTADVLLFVHGYVEVPRRLSTRIRALRDDLRRAGYVGAVTALSWPSSRKGLPFTYAHDIHVAEKTAERLLCDAVDPLRAAAPPGIDVRVHVLSHSLGATYVRAAFQRAPVGTGPARVENLVFFGADVAACTLGRTPCPSLAAAASQAHRVTTYGHRRDSLLGLSELVRLGLEPRLGRSGYEASLATAGAAFIDGNARYRTLDPKQLAERWHILVAADDLRTRGYARPANHLFPIPLLTRLVGGYDGPEIFVPSHEWYFQDPLVIRDLRLLLQEDGGDGGQPTRYVNESGGFSLREHPEEL